MAVRASAGVSGRRRVPTATSRFGVSRRESHDASEFYQRFPQPQIVHDDVVQAHAARDQIWVGDARVMDDFGQIADGSVALVVTSPPYYAGKEYETAIGEGHVPASYIAYLQMLHGVFAECVRKLEPGGRIAVNVANLGRKPYRSLSADVIRILEELGLLLRGEVIWVKGRAAGGSCAWGTFQRPGNPVLRDVTERIVIASKGRFDRALLARERTAADLPSVATVSADEFMDLTTDVWEFPSESATRVGHPAPFPVELPRRCIDLYTYEGDLVLDPFMGSGSTAVAAVRTGRHFVGFDTDPAYVARAQARVAEEHQRVADETDTPPSLALRVRVPATNGSVPSEAPALGNRAGNGDGDEPVRQPDQPGIDDELAQAVRLGRKASDVARLALEQAGFVDVEARAVRVRSIPVTIRARDGAGQAWYFEVVGGFSASQAGLRRTEVLWKTLGKAAALAALDPTTRLIVLTTELPLPSSPGAKALAAACGSEAGASLVDVVQLLDRQDLDRLRSHAGTGIPAGPANSGDRPPPGRRASRTAQGSPASQKSASGRASRAEASPKRRSGKAPVRQTPPGPAAPAAAR